MSDPFAYSLSSTDEDDIDSTEKMMASLAFGTGLQQMLTTKVEGGLYLTDDAGVPLEGQDIENINSFIEYCSSSKNFTEVSEIWDERGPNAIGGMEAEDIKRMFTPNGRLTASKLIRDLVGAYKRGEAARDAGNNPETDGSELPIEDQVSEQPDLEAVQDYDKRKAKANQEQAEDEAKAAKGSERADSTLLREQCVLMAEMTNLARYKYTTVSKFKKLPYHTDSVQTDDHPSNACIMVHEDPFNFINKLLIYPDTREYFKMRSEDIAALQPEIRFYKSSYDSVSDIHINTEIKFDTTFTNPNERGTGQTAGTTDLETLLSNKSKRNVGTGIKQFDISFVGTDPFAAKKDLRGKLKIYCASFDELFKVRKNRADGVPYRYIDLALKTTTTGPNAAAMAGDPQLNKNVEEVANMTQHKTTADDINSLNFAIKARIGIRPPKKITAGNEGLLAALSRNAITVQMTPVTHEFNFNDDGSLEFNIDYVPFISDHFNSSAFDIFGNNEQVLADKLMDLQLQASCQVHKIKELNKLRTVERKSFAKAKMSSILMRLHNKQQIHYLTVPAQVSNLMSQDAWDEDFYKKIAASMYEFKKDPDEEKEEEQKTEDEIKQEADKKKEEDEVKKVRKKNSQGGPVSIGDHNIPFFYLHDLVDVCMEQIEKSLEPGQEVFDKYMSRLEAITEAAHNASKEEGDEGSGKMKAHEKIEEEEKASKLLETFKNKHNEAKKNYKNFRVVLGPMEVVDPRNPNDVEIINLGDVPIAVKYFQEFVAKNVIKVDRYTLPLASFLQKLIQQMLSTYLNSNKCSGGAVKHRVLLNKHSAHCYNNDATYDDITRKIIIARANAIEYSGLKEKRAKSKKDHDPADVPTVDRLMANYYPQPILQASGLGSNDLSDATTSNMHYNYLIFYASRAAAIDRYQGDYEEDTKRGVHHYSLGRDEGIVKSIKLMKDTRPMFKEMRFESSGVNGLKQLIETYHVNVETYANFNVFPGTKIFVDPAGWSPMMDPEFLKEIGGDFKNLTEMGIGGYYDVTEIEHSFGPGVFSTSFKAFWTNGIGRWAPPAPQSPAKKEDSKCKSVDNKEDSGGSKSTDTNAARTNANANPNQIKALAQALGIEDDTIEGVQNTLEQMGVTAGEGYGGKLMSIFGLGGPPSRAE